jgi:hypothetical protein
MSLTELPEYKIYIVRIYISPDGKFDKFINKLDLAIKKLLKKDKILFNLVTGIWISFMRMTT